jgi:uncharacterized protein with von Willebrand factor type A (vWA) domain
MTDSAAASQPAGRLPDNILHFARALRVAGLPIGPGRVLDALRAVEAVGLANKDDFYWALNAVLVNRRDQQPLFDQAFHVFWRNPQLMQKLMALLLPEMQVDRAAQEDLEELSRRLAEALQGRKGADRERDDREEEEPPELELDASLTFSAREILQKRDFEKMSTDELAQAKRAIAAMRLPVRDVATRRFRPDPRGRRADMRATLRAALRQGGDTIPLAWKKRRRRPPPLVVLCDISGSMAQYSRMLLHFLHAVTNDRDRVHSFVFATRLSNVTRYLRHRDVDVALDKITEAVDDWSGGTRIGACLKEFNRVWSRRVLGQGAVVLVITDGLDRRGAWGVAQEMERLHKSCRRLIWLNPLLRYDAYAPKTLGARAILPHVDEVRSVHNLESLSDLAAALRRPAGAPGGRVFASVEDDA